MASNSTTGFISKIHIEKFRKIKNLEFTIGKNLTAIVGQNGSMKTSILGMLSQPFSWRDKNNPMTAEKTIDGLNFESKFKDKFRMDINRENAGEHIWTLLFSDNSYVNNGCFKTISINRSEKGIIKDLRFWNAEGREAGQGYIQYPVQYLSLKRLSPIGEEKSIKRDDFSLSDEEKDFINTNYNKILLTSEIITSTELIKSSNKSSLLPSTSEYGPETISAGQDNISKIITAILSFKRLKKKYPEHYKGGLLFIDEIDSVLYPAAQIKLIDFLNSMSSKLQLQIIFTTHSPTIIKHMKNDKFLHNSKVIFLRNRSNTVIYEESITLDQIIAHLNVEPIISIKNPVPKIRVYSEDVEAREFAHHLLPSKYKSLLDFVKVNIGADELISLVDSRKVPEFKDNIILLDGDKHAKNKNILTLPGEYGPDHLLYDYLSNLDENDEFWEDNVSTGGYSKQFCFSNYTISTALKDRCFYKDWYNSQKPYWKTMSSLAYKEWVKNHPSEREDFLSRFLKVYNYVAKRNRLRLLD